MWYIQNWQYLGVSYSFKDFPDKGDYIVMKKRKSMQDGSAVFFDIHKLFLARTMWPDRQQQQKESCKPLTMVVRGKGGIVTSTSHSTNNSMPLWRTTQIMATVRLIKASNLPLSSRHQEHWVGGSSQHWPGPTRKVWYRFWCKCVLSWPNGQKGTFMQSVNIAKTGSQLIRF